jgi:hypothetical protein
MSRWIFKGQGPAPIKIGGIQYNLSTNQEFEIEDNLDYVIAKRKIKAERIGPIFSYEEEPEEILNIDFIKANGKIYAEITDMQNCYFATEEEIQKLIEENKE